MVQQFHPLRLMKAAWHGDDGRVYRKTEVVGPSLFFDFVRTL